MKRKSLLVLSLLSVLTLSSCTLFDDSDIAIHNNFNIPEDTPYTPGPDDVVVEGVVGKEVADVPDTLCFKNVSYASSENSIKNTYAYGQINHQGIHVNNDQDYYATGSSNNYDLYVPKSSLNAKSDDQIVILFIHGGAWVSGFKTDVNPYVHDFAKKGYITATIKYTLLKRDILKEDAEDTGDTNTPLSIFRDLDEIDASIKSLKEVLQDQLGFTGNLNLVIGGASSGSHLAMLYTYSRGEQSALPISFIVDAVGPTDIKSYAWKRFIDASDEVLSAGISKTAIASQASNIDELKVAGESFYWNEYQTMRIANGMCGLPHTITEVKNASISKESIDNPNAASQMMTDTNGGEDLLSVTYWINNSSNTYPIICAYAGKDSIVGICQYANLQNTLDTKGIKYGFTYFKNSEHDGLKPEDNPEKYTQLINSVDTWCSNILAGQPLANLPID